MRDEKDDGGERRERCMTGVRYESQRKRSEIKRARKFNYKTERAEGNCESTREEKKKSNMSSTCLFNKFQLKEGTSTRTRRLVHAPV